MCIKLEQEVLVYWSY